MDIVEEKLQFLKTKLDQIPALQQAEVRNEFVSPRHLTTKKIKSLLAESWEVWNVECFLFLLLVVWSALNSDTSTMEKTELY